MILLHPYKINGLAFFGRELSKDFGLSFLTYQELPAIPVFEI